MGVTLEYLKKIKEIQDRDPDAIVPLPDEHEIDPDTTDQPGDTWESKAFHLLRNKDPHRFEAMSDDELDSYLANVAERAAATYKALVERAEERGEPAWWARYQAEELVTRDILDPTT
ncbi:MAG: hypothetical protein F4107_12210 [Gemmatimonadetes bacterium]|nr:hypothetical protein [Gemmatimonadota bacterium]MYD13031.1 hypothetical protein [Gemmatimonadota bacterium]MYI66677.1 hypothetical protein [Gemmatimonadota bacterium]